MSTPSASSGLPKSTPLQAQNGVSTPNNAHLAALSSSVPRSVPSPAAHRAQAGKSPFNAASLTQNAASGASQNHPTSSSGVGGRQLGSSPAGAMVNFDSPAALGLTLSSLGVMEGGVGMGISMSGLSMGGLSGLELAGSSMVARADDEERRRRLEAVLGLLSEKPGRVCQEGVERLSRKLGLEVMWEDGRKDGGRLLSIAGQTMIVDVEFKGHRVERTSLSLPTSSEAVAAFAEPAGKVLRNDLIPPAGTSTLNLTLEKFAKNLGRLARLDRLSTAQVNCIDAMSGIYKCLKRLHEHEKNATLAAMNSSRPLADIRAEREVLCKKSGRPRMHTKGTIGLSLDYWMEHSQILPNHPTQRSETSPNGSAMDVDGEEGNQDGEENKVFSLSIDCESSPAELYPPIRVSESWISPLVEVASQQANDPFPSTSIDWQDPPPTYASSEVDVQSGAMNLDGGSVGKLPNIRFVAKLSPPLVLPLQIALQMMQDVHADIAPETIRPTTYDQLKFRRDAHEQETPGRLTNGETKEIHGERKILVPGDSGQETDVTHIYTLFTPKVEYARVLEAIPFSHPRQIVQILPILRQYASLSSILDGPFAQPVTSPKEVQTPLASLTLSELLDPLNLDSAGHRHRIPVDLSLTIGPPNPRLTVVFPLPTPTGDKRRNTASAPPRQVSSSLAQVTIQITPNGNLEISDQQLGEKSDALDRVVAQSKTSRIAKALNICEDVGVWVEWIKRMKSS